MLHVHLYMQLTLMHLSSETPTTPTPGKHGGLEIWRKNIGKCPIYRGKQHWRSPPITIINSTNKTWFNKLSNLRPLCLGCWPIWITGSRMHLVNPRLLSVFDIVNSIDETDLSPHPMGRKEKYNPLLSPHMPHASPGWGWWGFPMTSALV